MIMLGSAVATVVMLVSGVTGLDQQQHLQHVVVHTPHGALRGIRSPVGNNSYVDRFLAIPYAMPPVGNLRFHAPVPNKPWTGTRDATTWGPTCPQEPDPLFVSNFMAVSSEDCLQLNVFTPKPAHGPLPVLVWIHGGGYVEGTASHWDMTHLAAKGIVVVTINYRLGAFGFLSTEDEACPGNNGLLDQIRALEWVRDVISAFNGDPTNVTIAGESAGSGSVSLLTLSSKGRGLFHRAIMESGTALSPWAVGYPNRYPDLKKAAWQLASMLGCNGFANSMDMVACLKTKNVTDVEKASTDISKVDPSQLVFRPIPEASFGQSGMFSATPEVLFREGRVSVPILIGFNTNETAFVDKNANGVSMAEFQQSTRMSLQAIVNQTHHQVDTDRIVALISEAYAGNVTDPLQLRNALYQINSDYSFIAPTVKAMQLVQNSPHPVTQYFYRFSYRSANRLNNLWQGVVHADELQYMSGYPIGNDFLLKNFVSSWTNDDRHMSDEIMTLWSNFVKYGDPTPDDHTLGGTRWFPWRQDRPQLLNIDLPASLMMDMPVSPSRLRVWNDVIPAALAGGPSDVIG